MLEKLLKHNLIFLLFFASSIVVLIIAFFAQNMMSNEIAFIGEASKEKMVALSRAAARLHTAEEIDKYLLPEDMEKPGYEVLRQDLIQFAKESEIAYAYYLRLDRNTNKMQFIADNTEVDFTGLSTPQVDRELAPDEALSGKSVAVELGSYSDGWEGYITAFSPVYYSDGRLSDIIAGVDMKDVHILESTNSIKYFFFLIVAMLLIILSVCILCLIIYRRKVRQADAASVSKSAFLSNMSHEMRTPMNAIIGMAQIAKGSEDREQVRYCLNKIDSAAQHLLGVINDILDISKIESGKFILSETNFSFDALLKQVSDVITFMADRKQQIFTVTVSDDVPEFVSADRQRIAQVLTNLISNAIKFTPEQGTIDLDISVCEKKDDIYKLEMRVRDNGIGISKEQQAILFSSFQQADNSISRRFGGTGLGLSITKSIALLMGGSAWVESEIGEGSTFFFTANVKKISQSELMTNENARINTETNKQFAGKHILLAEDVAINSEILVSLLSDTGLEIDCAVNGQEACELYSKNPLKYDLIFMDIHMPLLDGFAATKIIRGMDEKNAQTIPIIAMTANVFIEDIEKCLNVGMNSHVGKPVNIDEVINVLEKYLGQYRTEIA